MKFVKFLIILSIAFGCKKDNPMPDGYGNVQIRIWNDSSYVFDDLFVDTNGGLNEFGSLKPDEISEYKKFIFAYRLAYVSFKIDGQAYLIQPVDYLGEEKLQDGKYTYKIDVTNLNSDWALLDFIID
jgi:hypothetical protein